MSKNYNFHQSLEDKCHRFLNAVELGTVVAIHRRVAKDECFVVLRGKVGVTTHDDDGAVIGDVVLSWGRVAAMGWIFLGVFGIGWRRWCWGVLFLNVRMGAFVGHEVEGILEMGGSERCQLGRF